jgi:hypothetical protein
MGEPIYLHAALESFGPCATCGIVFAGPDNFVRTKREQGGTFFCPNGHSQHYGKGEVQKLRDELEATKKRMQAQIEWEKSCRSGAERKAIALKGQVTKIKNRVGNGVCPCCNRTFQNLMAHMKTKHPEFKDGT